MSLARQVATIGMFTVIEALRNRVLWLCALFLLSGFLFTEFLAAVVLTERAAFQASFLAAMLRLSVVVLVSVFVVTSTVREFQDKGVELLLSLPLPRWVYLAGKLLGFVTVAVVLSGACATVLLLYAPAAQCLFWGISLVCELLIVCGLCLLCLLTFNQVTAALCAVALFYASARTISAVQLMTHGPFSHDTSVGQQFIDGFIATLAVLLPDLSRFGASQWLVYGSGTWPELVAVLGQTGVYTALLFAVALFDLYRKEF